MSITSNQIQGVLNFMTAEIGKVPYSENTATNPATGEEFRFGPTEYDCSGLVYSAMKSVGIDIPASDAIASKEADVLSKYPGVKVIKNVNQVGKGDLVFFTGASPDASSFGPIGHVGMATSSSQYVSAFDTQSGITLEPLSNSGFVVALDLSGASLPASGTAQQGNGVFSWAPEILDFASEADTFVNKLMWLANPSSWLRIGAFLVGLVLLLFAIHAFIAVADGSPIMPKAPSITPIPVPV